MITLAKNKNNDLYLDSTGNLALSEGLQACIEACENAVSTMLSEQIYQTDEGIPNFDLIWNGVPNLQQAEIAFRNIIESVENVTEVVSFEFLNSENVFSYNCQIKTTFGIGRIYNGL